MKPSRITSVQPNQPDCLQFADLISLRPSQLSLPPYSPASTSSNPLRAPFVSPLSRISLSFSNFGSRRIQGHRIFLLPRRNEGRKCFESWKLFGKFVIGYSTNHPDCCLDAICPPYLATFREIYFHGLRAWRITENGLFERIPLPSPPVMHVNLPSCARVPFVPVCVGAKG